MLRSHHCREVESNLVFTLSAITAFSFAHHVPSPLLLVVSHMSQSYTRTSPSQNS